MTYRVETKRTAKAPWRDNGIRESNYVAALIVWEAIRDESALIHDVRLVPLETPASTESAL